MTAGQPDGNDWRRPLPRVAERTASQLRTRLGARLRQRTPKNLHKCSRWSRLSADRPLERRQKRLLTPTNEAGAASKAPGGPQRLTASGFLPVSLSLSFVRTRPSARARAHALCLLAHTYLTFDVCSLITPRDRPPHVHERHRPIARRIIGLHARLEGDRKQLGSVQGLRDALRLVHARNELNQLVK